MVIRTRFDIDQKIGIKALKNHSGEIYQIRIDGKNLLYDVRYWIDMKPETVSLSEFEISEEYEEVL